MTADLSDSISGMIAANNAASAYLAAGEWDNAVEAYKAAGNAGATQVGPGIDARTHGVSGPQTHQAWILNGELANVNSGPSNGTPATQTDANNAAGLFSQMYNIYQAANKAITSDPSASPSAKSGTKPGTWSPATSTSAPTTASAPSSLSLGAIFGGALVGAAVIGVAIGTLPAALGGALVGTLAGAWLGKKGT